MTYRLQIDATERANRSVCEILEDSYHTGNLKVGDKVIVPDGHDSKYDQLYQKTQDGWLDLSD